MITVSTKAFLEAYNAPYEIFEKFCKKHQLTNEDVLELFEAIQERAENHCNPRKKS